MRYEDFRRDASLLRGRFRFVPKDELGKQAGAHLLDVHDVLEASPQAARIETLIGDWRTAAAAAVEDVHRSMLEFDVPDFVYLDCFRLYREGTTLGAYLRWLMTAHLQSKVTGRLDAATWAEAETMRLFDVDAYPTGNPDQDKLVKAFEGPGQAVGRAYGAILVDSSRSSSTPFPGALEAGDLLEGDMFVKRVADGQGHQGARVLLVMTPSCDLVVRGGEAALSAGTVLLLPGTLQRVDREAKPRAMGDKEFVHVDERSEGGEAVARVYAIDWHTKGVVSMAWADIKAGTALGDHERLGRLREPYFNHVREKFVAGVTRIGREVPPLFPEARAGEVCLRVMRGAKAVVETLMRFDAEDALVWSFPASLRKPLRAARPALAGGIEAREAGSATASRTTAVAAREPAVPADVPAGSEVEDGTLFHVSRRFLGKLAEAVAGTTLLEPGRRDELAAVCRSLGFSWNLLQPGRKGPRTIDGRSRVIEIKTGHPEAAGQRNTQSEILLLIQERTGP